MFVSDAMISGVIDNYQSPRARYDMEDSLPIILVFSRETKKPTIIFTCMQISLTIGGPKSSNRMRGKIYVPIIHQIVCLFLDVSGAKNRKSTIPDFTTGNVLIFRQALYKVGAAKITKDLCRHGLLPESVEFLSPSQVGHQDAVSSVANQIKLKTGEMPTLVAAASKLGRRAYQGTINTIVQMGIACKDAPHQRHCQDRNCL